MLITTLKGNQDINRIYEGQKKIRKEIAMSFVVVNERGSSEGRTRDQRGWAEFWGQSSSDVAAQISKTWNLLYLL